ncbi:MAG: hypothetical protein HY046_12185 [Acidobacteria bacterium]|nr:hypothetical protein [Acidobacteriota bacterium]
MRPSLRETLADSHISAVAIAVLLALSINYGVRGLLIPIGDAAVFLFTAVAILDIPYFTLTGADGLVLTATLTFLFNAFVCFAAAWLLSRWSYGKGPLRSLNKYRTILARRSRV